MSTSHLPILVLILGVFALVLVPLYISKLPINDRPFNFRAPASQELTEEELKIKRAKFSAVCAISFIVLASALWIILSRNYPEAEQKWAFAAIGTILGYWLKP